MTNSIKLPQLCWEGVCDLDLQIPEEWQVETCNMAGYNRKALTAAEIREAVRNPIGMAPIRTLAKGRKQVVIIFDDMTRATRTYQIVPHILEELAEAGIPDKNIRFIVALGTHGVMNRYDFVKKLGEDILRRFPVYNHNAFGNCVSAGITKYGTEILANAEVMACDLKIAIGSVVPHVAAGFGGGGKIVLPGVCHIQTNEAFHVFAMKFHREHPEIPAHMGTTGENGLRMNMDEAVRLIGLDMTIDTLMNAYGETVAVYAGQPNMAFDAAVKDAQSHYLTPQPTGKDIAFCNAFAKVGELEAGMDISFHSIKPEGGDIVLIGNAPEGHVVHYLFGPFGNNRRKFQMAHGVAPHINHLIIYNEYPDLSMLGFFGTVEKITFMSKWDEVLAALKQWHPGQAKLVVYPNSDVQYGLEMGKH